MKNLFIFGMGYSARFLGTRLEARGWRVTGTGGGLLPFTDEEAVHAALAGASHILSSVPPADNNDPVLERYGAALAQFAADGTRWLGYLSSTGVYGDTCGAWVDETAPTGPKSRNTRRSARAQADARWLELGARIFRLPGIYGPPIAGHKGRSALDRVRAGTAHRIDLPHQIFSRVHVSDIATGIIAALDSAAPPGAYNLADDTPCHQNAVIEEACRLLRLPPPPMQSLDEAGLSPAARAFYAENRRVANGKARRILGWRPQFPSFREGLAAILAGETR